MCTLLSLAFTWILGIKLSAFMFAWLTITQLGNFPTSSFPLLKSCRINPLTFDQYEDIGCCFEFVLSGESRGREHSYVNLCICSSSEVCQEVACRVVMWCVLSAVAGSSCSYTSMQENKLPLHFKEALGFR